MSYYIGTLAEMPENYKKEVETFIIDHKDAVVLSTKQGEDVHLTIMGFLSDISIDMLYMQTNRQSSKVNNIEKHKKVEIAITSDTGGVVLTCIAEIVDNEELKKEKWESWMIDYHKEGPSSPDYVLLRFIPQFIQLILIEC